jgi:hypothetical protein
VSAINTDAGDSFIGHTGVNAIQRSTDGGQTWTGVPSPYDYSLLPAGNCVGFAWSSDSHVVASGYVLGNSTLAESTDAGQTWTTISGNPADGLGAGTGIAYDDTVWVVAIVDDNNSGGPNIWTSPDLVTWTTQTTGLLDDELVSFVVADSGVIIAVGGTSTNTMCYSTDHGVSWTESTNPFDGTAPADAMVTDGSGNWFAWNAAGVGIGAIVQSLDNGATWGTPVTLPVFATVVSACFLPGTGWVTVWGPEAVENVGGAPSGPIVYAAPVADPLVISPTGYVADNIYAPVAMVAV